MTVGRNMPPAGTGYGPCIRFASFRFRAVYRHGAFIGFVWFERQRRLWMAALPDPAGAYPFLTADDGRIRRWTRRDGAATALHMLARGIAL